MTKIQVENCAWNPPDKLGSHGRNPSDSRMVIEAMLPGDTLKITHPDLCCRCDSNNRGACSLTSIVNIKKREGWDMEIYHLKQGVAVVTRRKPG